MNNVRRRRLLFVLWLLLASALVVSLVVYALGQNMHLFYTPTQIVRGEAPLARRIRVGGLVEKKSVQQGENLAIHFVISDLTEKVKIEYQGILPDLFREGQGIVATGQLNEHQIFVADEILAKHDENYMPPEVIGILKDQTTANTDHK